MIFPKIKDYGELLSVGILFPVCIGIGYGFGALLDSWFETEKIFRLIGILFGIGSGFYNLFRIAGKFNESHKNDG